MRGLSSSSGKKTCPYAKIVVPHGAGVCHNGKCVVCNDGDFEAYEDSHAPKFGLLVSVGPT